MPPSLPTPHQQPQPPENKFPNCLEMKLEGVLVQPESQNLSDFWETSNETEFLDLHLTINFNEQWEFLSKGRVKFGIKGGELRLNLKNAEIVPESCAVNSSLKLSVPEEKQEPESFKDRLGRQLRTLAANSSLNGSKKAAIESPVSICHLTKKFDFCAVDAQSEATQNHAWGFEEEKGELVLKGLLNRAKLATLKVNALPCCVEATFAVSQRDVCITEVEGLWSPDISRNKKVVLNRLIIQRLLNAKLNPYVSRGSLNYD
ncbi:MAG: hypothetical protein U7123_12380 [Potamolinea sp.]